MGVQLVAHVTARGVAKQLLRCQYLYFCTSKASKVSASPRGAARAKIQVLSLLALLVHKCKYGAAGGDTEGAVSVAPCDPLRPAWLRVRAQKYVLTSTKRTRLLVQKYKY